MKITPKRYIQGFCLVVIALAIAREVKPSLAFSSDQKEKTDSIAALTDTVASVEDTVAVSGESVPVAEEQKQEKTIAKVVEDSIPFKPHRIFSVTSFKDAFPDENDVQLIAAQKNGIKPVRNREEAEKRKGELVYIGSNPYFYVDRMRNSIPYLVPSASVLLQDIGRTFYDSLQIKGIPLHKIIVTSVLRSKEDVANLQKRNQNAAQNSCHQYGTTFDICYNRYKTVEDPNGPKRRVVRNDSLKWVLSEVLNDIHKQNRCYIKYEVKQGCFHITVR